MTIQSILEKYKLDSGFISSGRGAEEIQRLSTGSLSLDLAIGGGIPKGMITVIVGDQSTGKTTVCTSVAIQAQKEGKHILWNDTEFKMDLLHAERQGLDLDKIHLVTSTSIEEAADLMIELATKSPKDVGLLVWDSLAQSFSNRSLAKDNNESAMASSEAAAFARVLPRIQAAIYPNKIPLICTNQWRIKGIGSGVRGGFRGMYGGYTLTYTPSIIVHLTGTDTYERAGVVRGQHTSFKVVKNQTGIPFSNGIIDIDYDEEAGLYGISRIGEAINIGLKHKIITQAGPWYSVKIDDEVIAKGQGIANLKIELGQNPEALDKLIKLIS